MTLTPAATADALMAEFAGPWRDDTPVFACCRRVVAVVLESTDLLASASLGATERVQALRSAVETEMPGHLDTHRCCAGHLADVAFDLPDLSMPAYSD